MNNVADLLAGRPHLRMHALDGLLLEGVPLNAIADALGTPTWVYGAGTIRVRARVLAAALRGLAHIHYAMKANDHLAILALLAAEGFGVDVVSGGELARARHAGVPAARIVFSGVGKSDAELRQALAEDVAQINVESAEELDRLSAIAAAESRTARVALRVNPDVDADTHAKIATGRAGDKFGIGHEDIPALYSRAAELPGIRPVGLAVHIGSQVLSMAPYRAAYGRLAELVRAIRSAGGAVEVVDCGGGLPITYHGEAPPVPEALAGVLRTTLGRLDVRLLVEPGRWLVGPSGVLLASVVQEKRGAARFVVLDAAMNDLLRPALYDAWHEIVPLDAADAVRPTSPATVVGPVCESGDVLGRARALPPLAPDARVAILDAGAYGAVMSSTYNARPLAAQALIDGGRWAPIRARQTTDALWADERVPAWLGTA